MVYKVKTDVEFKSVIDSDKLTVVDFFAEWCGPCRAIAPKFTELSVKFDNAQFIKVDADETALEKTINTYHISSLPTFILFKNGEMVGTMVGANVTKLTELIEKNY